MAFPLPPPSASVRQWATRGAALCFGPIVSVPVSLAFGVVTESEGAFFGLLAMGVLAGIIGLALLVEARRLARDMPTGGDVRRHVRRAAWVAMTALAVYALACGVLVWLWIQALGRVTS